MFCEMSRPMETAPANFWEITRGYTGYMRAAAAWSQAGRAGPDEPIRAIPAGRMYATDVVRQMSDAHQRLMPPPRGRAEAD